MRGPLSHVEQHAFCHLQDGEHTLDVVQVFLIQSTVPIWTKKRTLARGLDVVFALCFSPLFCCWVFFFPNISIRSSFSWFLSSFLFLSKWCRRVEQMMVLQELVAVIHIQDVSVVPLRAEMPSAILNNEREGLQSKHIMITLSVYTWEALSAREMVTNVLKPREQK